MTGTSVLHRLLLGLLLLSSQNLGCDSGSGEPVHCETGGTRYIESGADWRETFCRLDTGVAHGPYTKADLEGHVVATGTFDQGRADGEWLLYSQDDGVLAFRRFYVLDVPDGTWTQYFETGEVLYERHFNMGVACGSWQQFDVAGVITAEKNYPDCDSEVVVVDPGRGAHHGAHGPGPRVGRRLLPRGHPGEGHRGGPRRTLVRRRQRTASRALWPLERRRRQADQRRL